MLSCKFVDIHYALVARLRKVSGMHTITIFLFKPIAGDVSFVLNKAYGMCGHPKASVLVCIAAAVLIVFPS